jgi:phytoene dehydrogenase-like protein
VRRQKKDIYDAAIIGAGIGGLVCGCCLARAGMKVLMAEQHFKPGGYCTSFIRNGFVFDAAAHSFGGYGHGHLGNIFKSLAIEKKIRINRYDPSDIIKTPEFEVSFGSDLNNTIAGFQEIFPEESEHIGKFFHLIFEPENNFFTRIRSWSFKKLLDSFFTSGKLKAVLSLPLLGNGGLPPPLLSAFIGAKIFREFLLDGGYYPEGGMQELADALAGIFKDHGGELRTSCLVKKINVAENTVTGIELANGDSIESRHVISNCDSRQTLLNLVGRRLLNPDLILSLDSMIPSLSMFVVYLGMNSNFPSMTKPGSNVWYLPQYDVDSLYESVKSDRVEDAAEYFMVRVSPDAKTVLGFVNAPFREKDFWAANKRLFTESFIKKIETHVMPDISKYIAVTDAATPHTLSRYTLNFRGSAYGWASMPNQLAVIDFRKPSFIKGLYMTGHWTTQGMGIPGVVYSGYETANILIKKRVKYD